ncbi:MAG TPA: N-acetyl-alpha-D-glucosaminyl L-malate synthase BshA [Terriglobales bacterium]|nr:N-acetyl-alpha-D-glucosaminyl L-malate synthase BshA [Terriglobales bacterium]
MSDSLAIGMVCYPGLGGSAVIAADLAIGLARRGHRVHVIASSPPTRIVPQCERLTFHEVTVADYPLFEHPPYELGLSSAILEVCEDHSLDLVHSHYAVPHSTSAYLARQALAGAAPKLITTLHGTDVTRIGADPRYRAVIRFAVAASDGITVPSSFLRGEAQRLLGLDDAAAIEVIPNFVDTARFSPAAPGGAAHWAELFGEAVGSAEPRAPVLFHVSNFRPVKRVTDLIEVLARVRQQVPARLVLVGDGPERALAAERARAFDLGKSVCFLGKRTDFADHLRHADAFLLPSEAESFGVAALEALSSGVPVFGYRVGGLPEVVTPEVGELVEPFDVDALAGAVLRALADSERHQRLRAAARQRAVAHFHDEPAIARYESYYRRILAGANP